MLPSPITKCKGCNKGMNGILKHRYLAPSYHLYILCIWKLNCGQTIWDKIEVLLGMSWTTLWELNGNTFETNKRQKISPPFTSSPIQTQRKNKEHKECVIGPKMNSKVKK